jgi:YtkA-like
MNYYDLQTRVRLSIEFVDVDTNLPVDPQDVFLYVEDPDGVETKYGYQASEVQKVGDGMYQYDIDLTKSGRWNYQYQGVGGAEVASSVTPIQVRETSIDMIEP